MEALASEYQELALQEPYSQAGTYAGGLQRPGNKQTNKDKRGGESPISDLQTPKGFSF